MKVHSFARAFALPFALVVVTPSLGAAASPNASLLPAHVGASISFHYDAERSGVGDAAPIRTTVTLTRVPGDRLAITLTPDEGAAAALVAHVGADGTLKLEAPSAAVPDDRPIGGLPGDGGQQAQRSAMGSRLVGGAQEVLSSLRVLTALITSQPAQATPGKHEWPFAAAVGQMGETVAMTAHAAEKTHDATVVADGSGEVHVVGAPSATAESGQQRQGGDSGGRRRSGGGGLGGIIFGGGGFPGGGGGGDGGGVYGSGRGRQGGGTPSAVPATVALHVEATLHDGRLRLAHGSDTATLHDATRGDFTKTVRWTLTAL